MGGNGKKRKNGRPYWAKWDDEELLDLRFKDLGLRLEGTWLVDVIELLERELERRNIRFRPHFLLSREWFSPGGLPGVAVPFYLAHPRLMRLERSHMFEVEGGSREECLKIMRHETGHALQHAYQLQRLRQVARGWSQTANVSAKSSTGWLCA